MTNKIYFEWQQPAEYLQYIDSLTHIPYFIRLLKKTLGDKTKASIRIDEFGIHSMWKGIKSQINFENIHYIEFGYEPTSINKFKIITIYFYEDLVLKIPDRFDCAVPDDIDLLELKKFFLNKGYDVEASMDI